MFLRQFFWNAVCRFHFLLLLLFVVYCLSSVSASLCKCCLCIACSEEANVLLLVLVFLLRDWSIRLIWSRSRGFSAAISRDRSVLGLLACPLPCRSYDRSPLRSPFPLFDIKGALEDAVDFWLAAVGSLLRLGRGFVTYSGYSWPLNTHLHVLQKPMLPNPNNFRMQISQYLLGPRLLHERTLFYGPTKMRTTGLDLLLRHTSKYRQQGGLDLLLRHTSKYRQQGLPLLRFRWSSNRSIWSSYSILLQDPVVDRLVISDKFGDQLLISRVCSSAYTVVVLFLSMHLLLVVCCISCTEWRCCAVFFSPPSRQLAVVPHLSFLFHHWQSAYIFLFAGVGLLHLVKQSRTKNRCMFSHVLRERFRVLLVV